MNSRSLRPARTIRLGIAALTAMLVLPTTSCGNGSDKEPRDDRSSSQDVEAPVDGDDATPATDAADPNDVMANCLLERGLDVRRSGEVDGEPNAGVDLSQIDPTDPEARSAIQECGALADAARTGG